MKKVLLTILTTLFALNSYAVDRPSTVREVFFEGTNNELQVYKIYGRQDGNTMLVIGGIQGDEPGGFLSADLYSDIVLEKGNLIIVPRANLHSVIQNNRGVDGDMNRYFDNVPNSTEGEVVTKLMKLIGESDLFLNMHDGWGYHYPTYVDETRNPDRFGQSIIIDDNTYTCADGKVIPLGDMARQVIKEVNSKIENKNHHLHLFDTKTSSNDSKHKPMRKSATWFALVDECVPAFGVEGSKNMNFKAEALEQNIRYHTYSVNEFMKIMDIVPEYPQVVMSKPVMTSASFIVDDEFVKVGVDETLYIDKGSNVSVVFVECNYTRGITADILGYGTLNDIDKKFELASSTAVVFRKDSDVMAEINIKINSDNKQSTTQVADNRWLFLVNINGIDKVVPQDDVLKVSKTDKLIIKKVYNHAGDRDEIINFKGWYPKTIANNNGDDRNYVIDFATANMLTRYAIEGTTNVFPVIAGQDGASEFAVFYIEVAR